MIRLGLTGGIGSGKSTVAHMLEARGARIVDADAIARACTAAGGAAMPAILATFGPDFITPAGALDREQMRTLAFGDPEAKQRLEAIVHPLVGAEIAAQASAADLAGVRCCVFDIPLLVESKRWPSQLDRVLVVDCREETQVSRVVARSGMAAGMAQKIVAAQASRARRRAAADIVVFNDGCSLDQLRAEVEQIGAHFGL
ncbi:dephospho-CoA kinase [Rhodoferax koreense]|uniref:Dephospho-CoA kinase n=1 Tax=Rhodoferax koreensis TaxID=1842727 RepID=A0A1P8JT53_9BURK|nr:dephospho-CoA kinase [Rhodoferax koreense]APW36944.1 dephospho-CoA kinase [Rhodoferax koreense]